MALHGEIKVNAGVIARWGAVRRRDQPEDHYAIYDWSYEDVRDVTPVNYTGTVEHLTEQGPDVLLINVMLAKIEAEEHRKELADSE